MATLDFKGKSLVQNYHLTVKYHELVPKKDKSLTDKVRLDDNLIIHGDNLKALKALLPTYAGKVKYIYIDPPYNTGNEGWAYNDNVSSPMMQEWLGKAVDRDDLTRHDKWLCMMMPRLKLLRELLAQDGVIFISIDDNEVHHLRSAMDEIFGIPNFVATVTWKKKISPSNDAHFFSYDHEYLVAYAKQIESWKINRLEMNERQRNYYSNPDNDPRGNWNSATYTCNKSKKERPNLYYPITNPFTKQEVWPKESAVWAYNRAAYQKHVEKNVLYWGVTGESQYPRLKKFLDDAGKVVPRSVWDYSEVGSTQSATQELATIFNSASPFPTPKPTNLLTRILEIATEEDSVVLDSFAGSGSTAHAVLALNQKDGGNRKFILVECEDYADEITAERVRRVIKGVRGASDENLRKGLGGTFSYFELGKAIELDSILDGRNMPSYLELARYVFFTATGEEFDERKVNEKRQFIGESKTHEVFLFYKPDIDYLKKTALTLDRAEELGKPKANGKRRLIFAPTKYLDQEQLDALRLDFAQLPFEIYQLAR
jgi:adenine-specific DNA-methyltransferase